MLYQEYTIIRYAIRFLPWGDAITYILYPITLLCYTSGPYGKVVILLKSSKKVMLLVFMLAICFSSVSCFKNETGNAGENATNNGNIGEKVTGAHEFTSQDYGFSFQYNNLTLDSEIDGDQFAELTHANGDKATVKIYEPDQRYGDPEEWLTKSFDTSQYNNYETKQLKLGKYNARWEEYAWEVGGQPLRNIVLTAYKDGLFYNLIVTMKEENVDTSKPEFDVVVNSFSLADSVVDLDALAPWKTELPAAYPLDVIDLYGIEKIHAVVGDKIEPGKGFISVHYYAKDNYSAADIGQMFKDALQDSQNFAYSDSSDRIKITGIKAGYEYEIQVKKYSSGRISLVEVEVSKP